MKKVSEKFFRCSNCLMPNTRPRISFNKDLICNACQYHSIKQNKIDWDDRWKRLNKICKETINYQSFFKTANNWNVIVPASGGKDSTYVAHVLKEEFGMNVLTVSFAPQIPSWIDRRNWENFVYSGFDNILITPNIYNCKKYSKDYLIKYGLPRQPFVTGISTAIIQTAIEKNIKFIMFAENGEIEYGGDKTTQLLQRFNKKFLIDIYYEGQINQQEYGDFWKVPNESSMNDIFITWMSYFKDWDPEDHARLAVNKYGLEMPVGGNIGTFTNYSQIGDPGQDLHMYLCYLKYGFGRCCADVCIEIRKGRMTREEGLKIVNKIDGEFPWEFLDLYLDYFDLNKEEFFKIIDCHVNKSILKYDEESNKRWILK